MTQDLRDLRIQIMMEDVMTALSWKNVTTDQAQEKLKFYSKYIIAVRMVKQ